MLIRTTTFAFYVHPKVNLKNSIPTKSFVKIKVIVNFCIRSHAILPDMKKFNISGGAVEKRGKFSTKYMFSKNQHLVHKKHWTTEL